MAEPVKPRLLSSPSNQKGKGRRDGHRLLPCRKIQNKFPVLSPVGCGEGNGTRSPHPPTNGRLHTSSERVRTEQGQGRCRETTIGVPEVEEGNHLFVQKLKLKLKFNHLQPYQSNFLNEQNKISLERFQINWISSGRLLPN